MLPTLEDFKLYIQKELQGRSIRQELEQFVETGSSKAGKNHEEVFTRYALVR